MALKKATIVRVEDVKLPLDYDIQRDGITQSLLSSYQMCRQRFLFGINRWTSNDQNKNTQFGSLFHEMLDKSYHLSAPPNPKMLKRWIDEYLEKHEADLTAYQDKEVTMMSMVVLAVLLEYFKYYPEDWSEKRFTAIEEEFRLKVHGYTVRGKKDGRYDDKAKAHWIIEHKTKGRIEQEDLMRLLSFDLQNLFYITAEEAEYKLKILGVLYNIIRNPGLKHKKGETPEQYVEKLVKAIRKDPAHYFKRFEVRYPETEKARFNRELAAKLKEVDGFLKGTVPLYRNEVACKVPFRCKFLDACSSGNMAGYHQKDKLFSELDEPKEKE